MISDTLTDPRLLLESTLAEKRVYAVDDDLSCIQTLKLLLEDSGCDLSTFLNGEDVLDAVERKLPDLFIIDVVMNGIDGWELLVRIRENPKLKETPVIFITSLFSEEEANSLNHEDFCKVLPKPVCRGKLNDIISQIF